MKFHSLQRRLVLLFIVWVMALCVLATFAVHFFPQDSTWAWRLHYAMPIGAGVVFMVAGVFGSFAKLSFLYMQLAIMWSVTDITKREMAAAVPQQMRSTVPHGRRSRRLVAS